MLTKPSEPPGRVKGSKVTRDNEIKACRCWGCGHFKILPFHGVCCDLEQSYILFLKGNYSITFFIWNINCTKTHTPFSVLDNLPWWSSMCERVKCLRRLVQCRIKNVFVMSVYLYRANLPLWSSCLKRLMCIFFFTARCCSNNWYFWWPALMCLSCIKK